MGEELRKAERGKGGYSAVGISGLSGCCVIHMAGGLAVEMKEHIPVVSVICGLINIQCVGSSAFPASTTCCPLSQGKKKNMSIPIGVGGSEVYCRCVCGCARGTCNLFLSTCYIKYVEQEHFEFVLLQTAH